MDYRKHFSTEQTSQRDPIPGSFQVENSADGYSWAVDDWKRLNRFLVLGSEGGSYYASEHTLTKENAEAVVRCIQKDGIRVVNTVVEISNAGRAPKNDPALFVLAMCASLGDTQTKKLAFVSLPKVARIGTHLFHFINYVEGFRGWGRGLRNAVGDWYQNKTNMGLVYDATKYQSRDNWSHRDLLRLSHPKAVDGERNAIYKWIVKGAIETVGEWSSEIDYLLAFQTLQNTTDVKSAVALIEKYNFPRECIPTQLLKEKAVWSALLPHMPVTALIRNLGNLSKNGVLAKGKWTENQLVTDRLTNEEILKKGRVHPIAVLSALMTYSQGHGVRGKGEWEVVPDVVDALNAAFYLTFQNVTPTGKRMVLALDVSGSMSWGEIAGVPGLTPRVGAAAMAMINYRTEKNVAVVAFSRAMTPISLTKTDSLESVVKKTNGLGFGGTDCALPMLWAAENNIQADVFVVYTDSETWAGKIHPAQALQKYRKQFNIPAKLVVVGMVSNEFTVADPNDSGMLDVVGFDSAAPEIMSQFIRGEI